ncbi:MAG TPA: outer membrane beta-barrel protein [Gemmatimonadales bacterium]|jgi:opacity protein-like surface antigen
MRRNVCGGILALALLAGVAGTSAAQETGTPIFKAPYRAFNTHELGASFSDPGEGVSFALEGFYRYGRGDNDFSVRGGFADLNGSGGTRILLGGDFRTQVLSYSEDIPVDGSLTVGFGANVGDGPDAYYVPVGISVGRRFDLENSNTTFVPYVHPVIVPRFGGGDSDVDFALGLGVDVRFSDEWAVRASGGIGDIEGVGISLTYLR